VGQPFEQAKRLFGTVFPQARDQRGLAVLGIQSSADYQQLAA